MFFHHNLKSTTSVQSSPVQHRTGQCIQNYADDYSTSLCYPYSPRMRHRQLVIRCPPRHVLIDLSGMGRRHDNTGDTLRLYP